MANPLREFVLDRLERYFERTMPPHMRVRGWARDLAVEVLDVVEQAQYEATPSRSRSTGARPPKSA
jgi:hypothetical protein